METIKLANELECYALSRWETEFLYSEIFQDQQYTRNNIVIREGDCIFDVGANIGLFAIFMNQFEQNLRIFSFEPIKPIFEILQKNIEHHGLKNVSLLNYGISSENVADQDFVFFPHMPGNSTSRPQEKVQQSNLMIHKIGREQTQKLCQGQRVKGDVRTLSQAIQDLGVEAIDLLKIDVEGEELAVLQGIKSNDWKKIKQIVAEVHSIGHRLQDFQSILQFYGFEVHIEKNSLLPSDFNNFNVYASRRY